MPSTFTDISTFEEKATEFKANAGQFNVDEALGIVECFVAGIGNKDSVGDVCLPGAFTGSLKRRKPRVVWGHNWNEPIGKVLDVYEVGPNDPRLPSKMRSAGIGGLYARVQFNLKSERGKEAFHSVVFFGEEQEWSIGYKTLDAVFDPSQQANLLKEVELYEVSPVLHGANQLTGTISIKADKPLKDPDGGLTAAGRAHFKRTEGANLKPGVKGPADTPEKMRRKGSFLTRFYSNPSGPLVDDDGEPTRLALAAAAWGEPVPKNRQDAAELAAKGRRMLDRYGKSKKKSASNDNYSNSSKSIYDSPGVASNTTMGRVAELTKALSARFSAPVKVRTADRDMVVFDINNGGQSVTMRATYYFDGDEFMFGEPHQVRAETVYIPANSPSGDVAGHAFGHDHDDDDNGGYREMIRGVQEKPHGDCGCGCDGAGTCGTSPKPMTWGMFKERNPGAHLFIRAMGQEKSEAFDMVNEVCEYHGLDVKELDDGIAVPFIDSISEDGYNAIMTIAENMSDSFNAKGIGGKLRRIGRTAGNMMDRFDPDARDADGDRTIQEGTRFARPDTNKPTPPRMMPKVKPIQVPQPEKVPIKPPTPAPTPTPTKVPVKPKKEPAYARLSGAMSGDDWWTGDKPPSWDEILKNMTPAQRRKFQEPEIMEIIKDIFDNYEPRKPKVPKGPRRGPTSEPYEEEWGILSGAMSGDKPQSMDDILKNMTPAQRKKFQREMAEAANTRTVRIDGGGGGTMIAGMTPMEYENTIARNARRRAGLSGAMGGDEPGKRPPKLQNWEKAAIEQMVERTGLPRELFDSLTITERVGNPEDVSSQARDFNLSKERIKALQSQLAKLRRDYKNAEMDDNRMGGDTDGGGGLSGSMGFGEEMDRVLETTDGDSAWEAWDNAQDRVKEKLDDMSLSELEDALDEMEEEFDKWGAGMQGDWNDTLADRLSWGDEDGVVQYLMRWEDMNKREAQKEASRLIDLYEAASQKEQAFQSIIGDLKSKIKELEKDDDYD